MLETVLRLENVTKRFRSGETDITVLDTVSFSLEPGESLSIMGPSGSGKTTLLALCAGLDIPSTGLITLVGSPLNHLTEDQRAGLRIRSVGFVFQNFQLLPTLTALENVMVPMELCGQKKIKEKAVHLLERVGLKHRLSHYPSHLSGGEQQRVALARAFANTPKILFADEPTGNLDEDNAHHMEALLFRMNTEQNTTLVLVTHNNALASKANRKMQMKGGVIIENTHPENSS